VQVRACEAPHIEERFYIFQQPAHTFEDYFEVVDYDEDLPGFAKI
jgi:hypothetical protein